MNRDILKLVAATTQAARHPDRFESPKPSKSETDFPKRSATSTILERG